MATSLHNIKLTTKQKGMLCAFTGYTGFAFADTCAKWLTEQGYSSYQVTGNNYFVACILLLLLSPWIGGLKSLWDKQTLAIQSGRGVLNFIASSIVVYSLSILPMASAYTMIFATPFFMVLFAIPLYKQHLPMDRIAVLILGFAGIIMAFQPWKDGLDLKLLIPLSSCIFIALTFITARSLKEDTSIFAQGFTPLAVALLINIFWMIPVFKMPDLFAGFIFFVNGAFVCGAFLLLSLSFRYVSASLASPFMYTEMVWALIFGYLLFADTPSYGMMAGAIVIIICGFYLVRHEK